MIDTDLYTLHAASFGLDPLKAREEAVTFNRVFLRLLELNYKRENEQYAPGVLANVEEVLKQVEIFRMHEPRE